MTTLREEAVGAHPGFPWLEADDAAGVQSVLGDLGWLKPGERVTAAGRAGEGNMNLTLRVVTNERSFVLKQARPWVEKYPEIAAPWDRSRVEQRFYERIAALPAVAERMPRVFGRSAEARIIVMEDLADARDLASIYAGEPIAGEELDALADYLAALHGGLEGEPDPALANREMRALNHEHIYRIPLDPGNGLDLDAHEPGLTAAARELAADARFTAEAVRTGERYLADGRHVVHGDFFPGSWLRSAEGVRVIDPEFGHCGDPALDVACALAHLALAARPRAEAERFHARYDAAPGAPRVDEALTARFAAIEVVRRLIGVAQLPIPPSSGARAALLRRARTAMIDAEAGALYS